MIKPPGRLSTARQNSTDPDRADTGRHRQGGMEAQRRLTGYFTPMIFFDKMYLESYSSHAYIHTYNIYNIIYIHVHTNCICCRASKAFSEKLVEKCLRQG